MLEEIAMQKYYRRGYMSGFEKFVYRRMKTFARPMATISKGGHLSFNLATMNAYVKEYKHAVLYYDRERLLIGVKFYKQDRPEAYKIRQYRDGKLGYVTAIAFLKYYEIPHDLTERYEIEWNERENMLIIKLTEKIIQESKNED